MNILQKVFTKKNILEWPSKKKAREQAYRAIQDSANKLWNQVEETMKYYNEVSCPCAFPRFRQFTSIDCTDYGASFYMSETEGFIRYARPYFDIQEVEKGMECYRAVYTCKKCGSTFDAGWSDFSIHVSRMFLKPITLTATQVGADIKNPIPFFVGLFGHKYPERSLFEKVDFETFTSYIRELRPISY